MNQAMRDWIDRLHYQYLTVQHSSVYGLLRLVDTQDARRTWLTHDNHREFRARGYVMYFEDRAIDDIMGAMAVQYDAHFSRDEMRTAGLAQAEFINAQMLVLGLNTRIVYIEVVTPSLGNEERSSTRERHSVPMSALESLLQFSPWRDAFQESLAGDHVDTPPAIHASEDVCEIIRQEP